MHLHKDSEEDQEAQGYRVVQGDQYQEEEVVRVVQGGQHQGEEVDKEILEWDEVDHLLAEEGHQVL